MRPRDLLIALSTLAAIAVSVLAVGGVLRWSQAVVALLVAIAVATTAFSRRAFARTSPLVALLLAAIGLTIIQLIPLPSALEHALVPTTAALRADGAELAAVDPWRAATADATASLSQVIYFLTLLGIAIIALRLATSERGRYRIIVAVTALCGLVAVIAGIHRLFALHALYGLYTPTYAEPQIVAPLLNGNSLACLMAVGATLAIGLAAHRKQPSWLRVIWLLHVVACGAVVVVTVSRGGTLALVGGAAVTVALLLVQRLSGPDRTRKRRARYMSNALPIGIIAGCLTLLVIYSSAGKVEAQLSNLSFDEVNYSRSKFAAWRSSFALLEESPWLGVGRGGFETSFTHVHEASGLATYAFLENEYLQALVDFGIPGGILLAGIALWGAVVALRRWRDGAIAAGALGALAVVAAQSNVDFGLEFLGLAAPVVAIAATVCFVPLKETDQAKRVRILRVAHAAALVVGGGLLFSSVTRTLDEDRRALSSHASLTKARASIERHPLDYYGYAVAAELLAKSGDPRAIRMLNHAMALHPTHPQLHRMAARMLLSEGRETQAAIEYATALRTTPDPRPILDEISATFSVELAAAALPIDYAEPQALVTELLAKKRGHIARLYLERILHLSPRTARACDLMFKLAEYGDLAAAETVARRCADRLPDYQARVALARQLASKLSHTETLRLLHDVESWQARRDEKIDAWLLRCDAHLALGASDDAKRCLRRLDASPDMLDARRGEIIKRIETINSARPLPLPLQGSAAPAPVR